MNDLASTSDLEARLGITFQGGETAQAQSLLDIAAGMVRAHAKQHITRVEGDELVIPGSWSDRILLPERPVIAVNSVSATFYNGTPYTFAQPTYYVDRDELVRYPFPIGLLRHFFTTGNGWLGPGYKLTINYDHGYDSAADPLPYQLELAKHVVLEMVTRAWVNPAAATQSMVGGVQQMYPAVGMLLTDAEKALLNDTFRRTSQTITLR